MCHYLCGGLHGRQKRVKAQSESSKSVVNSVLISREMPVFPGFLEIIRVVNMKYYSSNGYRERIVEPYKLLFKQESWYLLAYCHYRKSFRIFKVERISDLQITKETFEEREGYETPLLKSDFSNSQGIEITVRMDKSLEFLAIDFFGEENIIKNADNLYITFHSEYPSWVITTFASLGEKAEIISPNSLRTEVKDFLKNALKQYEI